MYKTGRFTKEECDIIKMESTRMTPDELATKLNRNPDSIRNYIKRKGLHVRGAEEQQDYAEHSLITSSHWESIKQRYTEPEQDMFTQHYKQIVGQFMNEVPYTELFQIIDYIHIEIEIQRVAVLKRSLIDAVDRLNKDVTKYRKIDSDKVIDCEDLICQKESSLAQTNKDLVALLDRKDKYAKAMKGTREDRVKRVENSKKTFSGFIAELLDNPEKMREVGINIEKHRLATEVEYENLHNLHTYADGENDPPILNADSVSKLKRED